MAKTRTIIIDQEALEPWAQRIDLVDAALLHHVTTRLTRRAKQHIISPGGIPLVWIHYPTVRAENWLLDIDERALRRRFLKLVHLRLLIRQQVSLGRERGSRTYFGISEELKARFEAVDDEKKKTKIDRTQMSGLNRIDRTQMSAAYDRTQMSAAYDRTQMSGQSLSISQSKSLGLFSPPSQEKRVDRRRARQGLLDVLKALPGGAQRVAQIEKERGKQKAKAKPKKKQQAKRAETSALGMLAEPGSE